MSHILFFFGSGVSVPSGMPGVTDITRGVFEDPLQKDQFGGAYVTPSSDSLDPEPPWDAYVPTIRCFLNIVREYAKRVLKESESEEQGVTYEDLFYLCQQVHNDQFLGPANLAVRPFSKWLGDEAQKYLIESPNPKDERNPLAYTASEACLLIQNVVHHQLDRFPKSIVGFQPLLDAIDELERVTIVTLNHDLLVEQLLQQHGVDYTDGFYRQDGQARRYTPESLFSDTYRVRIIKPHGSINWYLAYPPDELKKPVQGRWMRMVYIASERTRQSSIKDKQEREYHIITAAPSVLSGVGKEMEYNSDIFGDMMEAFLYALRNVTLVVESGFGWNDKGISRRLTGYLEQNVNRKLLLLHPNGFTSRYLDPRFNNLHLDTKQLVTDIKKYLCETTWVEIKKAFSL